MTKQVAEQITQTDEMEDMCILLIEEANEQPDLIP